MRNIFGWTLFLVLCLTLPFGAYAEDVRYSTHIKALFGAKCGGCHGPDSPEYQEFKADKKKYEGMSKGPGMDSYTYLIYFIGWPESGAIMRRLDDGKNTKDGKPGNIKYAKRVNAVHNKSMPEPNKIESLSITIEQ